MNIINKYHHLNLLVNNHSLNYYQRTRAHGRADCRVGKGRVKDHLGASYVVKIYRNIKLRIRTCQMKQSQHERAGTIWITTNWWSNKKKYMYQ